MSIRRTEEKPRQFGNVLVFLVAVHRHAQLDVLNRGADVNDVDVHAVLERDFLAEFVNLLLKGNVRKILLGGLPGGCPSQTGLWQKSP